MNEFTDPEDEGRSLLASAPPPRKALPPFEALRAFDAVARLKGIRRAAQSIGRDHTVISRHLRTLETWTGVRLVERNAAGVMTTEAGARYHARIGSAFDIISMATIELMQQSNHNHLNIWSSAAFALHWLSPRLNAFERRYPRIELELRPTDTSPDFRRYESDVDIRLVASYGDRFRMPDGACNIALAKVPIIAVASPSFLAKSQPIKAPADLLKRRLLHEDSFDIWSNWLVAQGVYEDGDFHGPRLWQGHLTLDAAKNGRGIALTNSIVASELLATGALVQVGKDEPSFQANMGTYYAVTRADRWNDPVVSKFITWIASQIAKEFPDLAAEQSFGRSE